MVRCFDVIVAPFLRLQVFYVYVTNKSFQSLGVIEDFSVYRTCSDNSHW